MLLINGPKVVIKDWRYIVHLFMLGQDPTIRCFFVPCS
jgi:hypothetical protein